jgi:Transposase
MDVMHERCAGLDVHKLTVVACVVTPGPRGRPHKEVRTFGTTSGALLRLADWLRDRGVPAAALEATGVSWRPVWNVLEAAGIDLLLANPQHSKAVPGRKTDVRLRHEVVSVAVGPEQSGPNLVFCHQYPTAACDRSNPAVRSPRDNVASPHRGRLPCEGRRRLPASGRSGARVEGPG